MLATGLRSERGSAAGRATGGIFLGLLLGAALTAAGAWILWPAPAATEPAAEGPPADMGGFGPAPVEVVPAVETVAAEAVQLLGSAQPARQSLVASEVDGLVVSLAADEGMRVRRGQVLVGLRTTAAEQQLAAARAQQQEAESRLTAANSSLRRLEALRERAAVSQRDIDDATAERDATAQAVQRHAAAVAQLEDAIERAAVRAPFSGRVVSVDVEVGEWVGRGDPILSLVDLSSVEVSVMVAERFISAVQSGFPVQVTFDGLPGREYAGEVRAVVPQAIPEARTFPVLVGVANTDRAIKGGMAARVTAQLGDPTPAVLVAKDALVRRGQQVLVYRLRPDGDARGEGATGMIEELVVQTGPARGQWQVVRGDVRDGDLVVVRGNERLGAGQPAVVSGVRDLPVPAADPDQPVARDPRSAGPS